MAEDGLRIAETVNHPFSLIEACYGVSMVYLRQGDVHRAIPVLERALGLCEDWHIPLFVPQLAAALGAGVCPGGACRRGSAASGTGGGAERSPGADRGLWRSVVACLSEAYLLAGRLEDARQRAAQAVELARQYQQRGWQAWALWLLGESTARQAVPEVEPAAGHYRQALALAERTGHAPAPGALPPRPGHAVCRDWPAGAGPCRAVDGYRDVSGYGDDLLAPGDRGGTGAGGGAVMDYQALLAQVLASSSRSTVWPIGSSSGGSSSTTRRWKTSRTI